MNARKTLFISDLHLNVNQPHITEQFVMLLLQCKTSSVDALYILGDLFEAWIGDDDDTSFHRMIIKALKEVTSAGIPIYFLRGNRDFLIGRRFLKKTGCQLLADETKINLYGQPVLLLHGDTLCTRDIAYMKWRKKARNPILHTLFFLMLPLSMRRKKADNMRQQSAEYTKTAMKEIMDVTQEEVERVMQKHEVHYLIHGHTHRPNIHKFLINNIPCERIVLGAWHDDADVLVWDASGKKELIALSQFSQK